jgi:hypothetical protein
MWMLPAYVSILFGVTVVSYDDAETDPGVSYGCALTLGIGSSLDVFDFLFGMH